MPRIAIACVAATAAPSVAFAQDSGQGTAAQPGVVSSRKLKVSVDEDQAIFFLSGSTLSGWEFRCPEMEGDLYYREVS